MILSINESMVWGPQEQHFLQRWRKWHRSERPLWPSEPHSALNQIRLPTMAVCKSNSENNGKFFSNSFQFGISLSLRFYLPCSFEQSVGSQIAEVFKTFYISILSSISNCSVQLKVSLSQVNSLSSNLEIKAYAFSRSHVHCVLLENDVALMSSLFLGPTVGLWEHSSRVSWFWTTSLQCRDHWHLVHNVNMADSSTLLEQEAWRPRSNLYFLLFISVPL